MSNKEKSLSLLNAEIKGLTPQISGVRDNIQKVLINVVIHVIQHHDIRPVQTLVDESTSNWKSVDRLAINKWLIEYAKCKIAKPELGEKLAKVTYNKKGREDINNEDTKNPGAKYCPWYKKASNPFAGFNFKHEVIKLASRASKMKTKKDQDKIDINQSDIELIQILTSGKSGEALKALKETSFSLAGNTKDEVVIINATEKVA